jgi:hypothetical protein
MPESKISATLIEDGVDGSADVDNVRRELAVLVEVGVESRFANLVDVAPDVRA